MSELVQLLEKVKYDANGLVPAVVQDVNNGEILMVAYMNREALEKTIKGPFVNFYSRSRNKMWIKGESSGHTQEVKEIYFDCDLDCVLVKVIQKVAACHVGYRTCFYRKIDGDKIVTVGEKVFEEDAVYKK